MEYDALNFTKQLYEQGLFESYSGNHFLIRALTGKLDYLNEYPHLAVPGSLTFDKETDTENFLNNFSVKFKGFYDTFNEKDMKKFIGNQLAAGKKNYNENQFFRAISEINVINFVRCLGPGLKEAIYEPELNENNKKNPEVRLIFENDIVVDLEVKTPGFGDANRFLKQKNIEYLIRLNVLVTDNERKGYINKFKKSKAEVVLPRVGKIKDYINSAGEKFVIPNNGKHINLLFINWTYTEFQQKSLIEPLGVLYNPKNGILRSPKFLDSLGINKEALKKISAIILYGDTFNSILYSNMLNIYEHMSYYMIPNELYCENLDINLLKLVTNMNPIDKDIDIEAISMYQINR